MPTSSPRRVYLLLAAGIVVLAAGLRLPALFSELWLDEIWSLTQFALRPDALRDVLWDKAFNHDNNHRLNTIYLSLLGRQDGAVAYRMLAFVSGVGLVAVVIGLGRRIRAGAGLVCGVLFAFSFILVVYSTEARGYGPELFFVFGAFLVLDRLLERWQETGRVHEIWSAVFWGLVILGFLSHLTYLHFYLGAGLWSVVRVVRHAKGGGEIAKVLLTLHFVPAVFVGVTYFAILRGMEKGGGPDWTFARLCDDALAWTFGYPTAVVPAALALAACLGVVGLEIVWRWREGDDRWILFLGVIVVAPGAMLLLGPTELMFARYFLVPLAFALFVVGLAIRRLGAEMATVLVVLFAAGNVFSHLLPFYRYGRGDVRGVIETLRAGTPGTAPVTVTARPMDLWAAMPLRFYADRGRGIEYRGWDRVAGSADVDWVAVLSQESRAEPSPAEIIEWGLKFELQRTIPVHGPSGMTWSLYRRRR